MRADDCEDLEKGGSWQVSYARKRLWYRGAPHFLVRSPQQAPTWLVQTRWRGVHADIVGVVEIGLDEVGHEPEEIGPGPCPAAHRVI